MADPVSLAVITGVSMAATAAGGAVTAAGQLQGGAAQKQRDYYLAAVADQNRVYEQMLGERRAGEKGLEQAQVAGRQIAAQGASGLDVGRGSAVEVQKSQQQIAGIEQQDIRYSAQRRAYGEQVQGELYKRAGDEAVTASKYAAAGTVLGTVGSVSSKWLQGRQLGMFGGGGIDTGMGLSPFGGSSMFG
jgi:hypothetical protein